MRQSIPSGTQEDGTAVVAMMSMLGVGQLTFSRSSIGLEQHAEAAMPEDLEGRVLP